MTKEEIIVQLEDLARDAKGRIDPEDSEDVFRRDYEALTEAAEILKGGVLIPHPITREQVEKVWRGEWEFPIFVGQKGADDPRCQCSECGSIETPLARHRFCPSCGAPMTDEAVRMVMERLEVLEDEP